MKQVLILSSIVLSLFFAQQAQAQRCLPGMQGVQVIGGVSDNYFEQANSLKDGYFIEFSIAQYLNNSNKWNLSFNYMNQAYEYDTAPLTLEHFTLKAGYLQNLITGVRKSFFLSLACSAVLGYEYINKGVRLLSDGARITDEDAFIYGVCPGIEAEYYLCDYIILVSTASQQITWGGTTGHFSLQVGAGLRFIIN